jgi:uncharacterized protein with von Willebrand factor type A (vWA) domain
MFLKFFYFLRTNRLPVSLREYLMLLEALDHEVGTYNTEDFYYLARTTLVKHEKYLDRFDQLFGHYFRGMELLRQEDFVDIPKEWLEANMVLQLTDEEKALIEAMGGLEKLMEEFRKRLEEQKERHAGGSHWIGTGGTSPFGAQGFNPEGVRVGPKGGSRRAVKVWDMREFAGLDDRVELNTRTIKMALRRLRQFTREGPQTELDLPGTIRETTRDAGLLNIEMQAARRNRVKVLLLLDVGGSMDDHVKLCEELFSAARHEFKHLEYYYFHNCLYETVWRETDRRYERFYTWDILHKYNRDWKVVIVGDAAMAPYELASRGGSIGNVNEESGAVWLQRFVAQYPSLIWLNPIPNTHWKYYETIPMIRQIVRERMFPLTLEGLTDGMRQLMKLRSGAPPMQGAA